ncbi:MAG: M16 family metallopeptidase [Myxococcota bacterium]
MRLLLALLVACAPKPAPVEPAPVAPAPPADLLPPMPAVGPEVPFAPPVPETGALSNGASVWVVPQPGLPLVTVQLSVPGGSATDPKGAEGTAALADRMLTQGAGKRDAEAFAAEVERLGIQLDVGTSLTHSTVTMSFMRDKLEPALVLLADMLQAPRFGKADFAREKDLAVSALKDDQDDPAAVAVKVAWATWFGEGHPYGKPEDGTVKGMLAVTLKGAQGYHSSAWNAAGARFTVAGDVGLADTLAALEPRFGKGWKATKPAGVTPPAAPAHDRAPIVVVDKPGSAQTAFYLVFPGLAFGDPNLPAARAGTIVLGGTFTSRLNALLREKKGYTYGVRARVVPTVGAGVFAISTRIRTDATADALVDLVGELDAIRKGVTAEEIVKARGAWRSDLVEAMETRGGTAGTFGEWHAHGLPPAALGAELAQMGALTPDRVTAAMAPYDPAKAVLVLVGDRAVIEPKLKEKGFTALVAAQPI